MTTITAIETDQITPRLLVLSEQFPELAAEVIQSGKIKLTVADRNTPIWVEYFDVDAPNDADNWRYSLSHTTPKTEFAGTFSHPTEMGCWIMAKRYFAENNYIEIPADNSHLSGKTAAIIAQGQERRSARASQLNATPQTGDIIVDASGVERRVCETYDDRCQTTTAMERSYNIGSYGDGSYSGSLGQAVQHSDLTMTLTDRPARFWTFRDGRAGGGRGVDVWVNVTVWTYSGRFGNGLWG